VSRGGRLLTGGTTLPDLPTGLFFDPTVIADVPLDARAMTEETFGPLYTVERFTEEDEVVTAANNTEAGLAAYLFTRDLDRALRIGEKLEFGMVAINDSRIASTEVPFGGVKTSGLGRESGHEGIEAYLETKTFAIRA
jgi:succinate-semialdehyde dehydrogenase/glutarate-semialdehyde dehydrogenase